jgi:hypothetical protein
MVCGMARSGAGIRKSGIYRLHKGEKVFSKAKVNSYQKKCKKCSANHKHHK